MKYRVTDTYVYCDELRDRIRELLLMETRSDEEEFELAKTCEFMNEIWSSACSVVHEDYVNEYFSEYIDDAVGCSLGVGIKELPSFIVIDYEATAKNLLDNWSCVEFEGETYYVE